MASRPPHVPLVPPALRRNHWMNQVARHASMQPDAVALRYRGTDTTWLSLHRRAQAFAAALARRGVGFGDRVLLLTHNTPAVVEAILGITTLGAMAVPVNSRLAPDEVAWIIDDADGDVLVADTSLLALAGAALELTDRVQRLVVLGAPTGPGPDPFPGTGGVDGTDRNRDPGPGPDPSRGPGTGTGGVDGAPDRESFEALVAEDASGFTAPDVSEDTPALIMYTSGTTGRPKGAMLDHGNLFASALTAIRASEMVDESDICFLAAPLFHIAGFGTLAPNFVLGIRTVLHPLGGFDAAEMLDAWEREQVTTVFAVPTQWQAICAEQAARPRDLDLRVLRWGASAAPEALLRTMAATFPDASIVAVFGQTEMSPVTCVLRGEDAIRKLGSVGRPIPTVGYRVVDTEMNDVPRGEVGEIVYRGPTLMQGYWRRPEATAESMAGGWFHSGDLVRQDEEGFVWVVDRAKDMIISGGENIYCAEVENAIASHPAVAEVAVYGRAHDKWGEVPVAAVVLRPDAGPAADDLTAEKLTAEKPAADDLTAEKLTAEKPAADDLTAEDLSAWLDGRLARFKHPKHLVRLEALPRNASGKVLKPTLRAQDPA